VITNGEEFERWRLLKRRQNLLDIYNSQLDQAALEINAEFRFGIDQNKDFVREVYKKLQGEIDAYGA
jgi:hypothetical protein